MASPRLVPCHCRTRSRRNGCEWLSSKRSYGRIYSDVLPQHLLCSQTPVDARHMGCLCVAFGGKSRTDARFWARSCYNDFDLDMHCIATSKTLVLVGLVEVCIRKQAFLGKGLFGGTEHCDYSKSPETFVCPLCRMRILRACTSQTFRTPKARTPQDVKTRFAAQFKTKATTDLSSCTHPGQGMQEEGLGPRMSGTKNLSKKTESV
eukprot:5598461-Amphidinium_carterae.1